MRDVDKNSYYNKEFHQQRDWSSSPHELEEVEIFDGTLGFEKRIGTSNHSHPEFQDRFGERVRQLQNEGRMLEEVTTEVQRIVFNTQLEMTYEYTSRLLGLPWSFEAEYEYGWGKRIEPSEDLSKESYETYQHLMSPGALEEDKEFLYEFAALTGVVPEKIVEELIDKGWIYESEPGTFKNKCPENVQYVKNFWEP